LRKDVSLTKSSLAYRVGFRADEGVTEDVLGPLEEKSVEFNENVGAIFNGNVGAIGVPRRQHSFGPHRNQHPPEPSALPAFDASNGLRNARQHFNQAYARRWEAHRKSCFSEMNFKVRSCLWACTVEALPVFVAAPLVAYWSGVDEAKNRGLLPYSPTTLIFDLTLGSFVVYITAGLWYFAKNELPEDSFYELVGLGLFVFGRCATIGVKYACYPDEQLGNADDSLSIKNLGYQKQRIRDKNQMATYVLNVSGIQKLQLCNLLYKSCLYVDTDLSTAFFHIEELPTGLSAEPQVSALEMWEHCLQQLSEVYTSDPIICPETGETKNPGSEDDRMFSLLKEHQCEGGGARGCAESHDPNMGAGHDLHASAVSNSDVHLLDPGLHADNLEDGVLLATFFRSRNRDITALAKKGKIPATVVALNMVFKAFDRTKKEGQRIFMMLGLMGLTLGFLPPFLRMMVGKTAFGDSPQEIVFRVWLCWATSPSFFIIFFFNIAPCVWYYSKLKLARELHAMLAGMGESFTCGGNVKVVWSPQSQKAAGLPGFEVDMRCTEDVAAWAALRQVLHGGNFGPIIHRKFQMYGVIMFSIFLAVPTLQALGSFYNDPGDGSQVIEVDVKILSILRMLLLAVPIIVQVLIAYKVNQYTGYQEEAVFRQARANMALSANLRGRGGDQEELADKLDRTQGLLCAVADEIRSSEESSPMRVLGLVAHPGVVISLFSVLTAIIVLEVRELGIVPFLE